MGKKTSPPKGALVAEDAMTNLENKIEDTSIAEQKTEESTLPTMREEGFFIANVKYIIQQLDYRITLVYLDYQINLNYHN